MTFRKNSMTWKNFQNSVEGFLISAMGWQCMAEVAAANGYPDHIHRWRNDVERILFIDLSFFISSVKTKTVFDRHRAINELVLIRLTPQAPRDGVGRDAPGVSSIIARV